MRKNQLVLIDTNNDDLDFRLDERTRELGRKGVATAREVLRQAGDRRAA